MRFHLLYAASCLFVLTTAAFAHGPTPQKVDETIQVKAAPERVWAVAGDYAGISKWDPVVKSSEGSNKKRIMTFANGEQLEEEVDEYDPVRMTYSYRMLNPNVKALAASSYSATLVVTSDAHGGSNVEWSAHVYRGDTENEPPDDLNDEAAKSALKKLFRAGLEGIKAKAEAE